MEVDLHRPQGDGTVGGQRERRATQLDRVDAQQQVVHDGIADKGGFEELIKTNLGLRHGVYLYNGQLTSGILGEAFHIPYKDLDILLAAFRS